MSINTNESSKVQELEKRVIELEYQNNLLIELSTGCSELLKLKYGNFALFALISRFNAIELEKLEQLIGWSIKNIKTLSKQSFIQKFEESIPYRKDMVESIFRAYKEDDMFLPICEIILSEKD